MTDYADDLRRRTNNNLARALHYSGTMSREGLQERFFSFVFRDLVYAQIWEDPVVDMDALAISRDDRIVTIASGGCNVMSYLCANPAHITAVDLNGAHVALNRLKLAAAQSLPGRAEFRQFFADADRPGNLELYHRYIAPVLDAGSRAYWEGRSITGRRRISRFARGFYRFGMLGVFIRATHLLARLHGVDPRAILNARTIREQRTFFEAQLSPLIDRPLIRWLAHKPEGLFGLGIPPAQYRALAADHPGGIAEVLRQRLERLACGFDLKDNYFAWQAFNGAYSKRPDAPTPPYLEPDNFARVSANAARVDVRHESMTEHLRSLPPASVDCVSLLDAQDWMSDADLNALWAEITRTARPRARVIFRTAANEQLLPGRIDGAILRQWRRDDARSAALHLRDRSSIYGAFHLYHLVDAP